MNTDLDQMSIFDYTMPMIHVTKPIRLIELFAGYGSQAMALERMGVKFEHYKVVEFDKYAVASYNAVHGTKFPTMDITKVHATDLNICETNKYEYIMTYSFPCFTGDTFVMTREGLKEIRSIEVGDEVITHTREYKKVVKTMNNGLKDIYIVKGTGFDEIRCTENHRFYIREMKRKYPKKTDGKRVNIRCFDDPKWVECKNLTSNSYFGTPINTESILPTWDGIDFEWSDNRKTRHKNELSKLMDNHSFWWIIGRYLGDGWVRNQGGIIICCDKRELTEITVHLRNCGFNYCVSEERTVYKIHVSLKELKLFCEQFGNGALNKRIPGFVFSMPCDILKSFIEGYVSADGYVEKKCVYKISTISKELAYGIAQCVAKAYKTPFRVYKTKRKSTCVIEGRICNQKDSFQVVWKLQKKKQDKAFYKDGYIWFPVNHVIKTDEKEVVYDIEVNENHSFTANNAIVHNCTDLSVAGKMAGMKKGSGTRSGLLWEVERILTEINKSGGELPQVLFMENVPQVISDANIKDFHAWQDFLSELGYTSYLKVLNAKDYGVAQNRERCFMFSFLGKYNYHFPEPIPLTRTMKDYLLDEVDEKYYINSEKTRELIKQLISDKTVHFETGNNPCKFEKPYIDGKFTPMNGNVSFRDIGTKTAGTITARYYKGIGSNGDNAIIELGKINSSQDGVVVDSNGISKTITSGNNNQPKTIVAMRGRNPENPSDRTPGSTTEQRLEPNSQGICNALTSVQKDNMVLEPSGIYTNCSKEFQRGLLAGISRTIKAENHDASVILPNLRIRKLTPRECGRLMDVSDEDITKMEAVNSNSQLYKQFWNSIVVGVMVAMFKNLNIDQR